MSRKWGTQRRASDRPRPAELRQVRRMLAPFIAGMFVALGGAPLATTARAAEGLLWADTGNDSLSLSDTGTQVTNQLFDGSVGAMANVSGVAAGGGFAYWTDLGPLFPGDPAVGVSVSRSGLDGSGLQTLVDGSAFLRHPNDVDVDLQGGFLYWTDSNSGAIEIMRTPLAALPATPADAPLSRAELEVFVDVFALRAPDFGLGGIEFSDAYGLAIDSTHGVLYWGDSAAGDIHSMNLDGTGLPKQVIDLGAGINLLGLDVDPLTGDLYFTTGIDHELRRVDFVTLAAATAPIANMHTQLVYAPAGGAGGTFQDVEVDGAAGWVYWSNSETGTIQRARLDGVGVETFLPSPLGPSGPSGLPTLMSAAGLALVEVPEVGSLLLLAVSLLAYGTMIARPR